MRLSADMETTVATHDPWDSGPEQVTYAEILDQGLLDPDDRREIRAEATVAHAAALLLQRGEHDIARLFLDAVNVVAEPDEWGDSLWLEVAPEHMGQFDKSVIDKLKGACELVSTRRSYGIDWGGVREVLPHVGPEWRENLRRQFSGERRPTNNGRRVRSSQVRFTEDYLAFTNECELSVYRALKSLQESYPRDETIGIFPLAGDRIPGKTWEPDVLVTYKSRAGVLEIDGPHHNARRAMDITRDHLLRDAGIAFVDRIPVEALADSKELEAVLRRFLKRLAEAR
jgi:hypothetical protein